MRICIYGAGAIGGYMGACLARAGYAVSLVARGPHMQAIQANGLTLRMAGESFTQAITCTDDPAELGPQDYVIVTLKAHSVPAVVDQLPSLFHDDTAVVMAVNGVPWWYFYDLEGPYRDRQLESVDPGGRQWAVIEPRRAIGCVVYPACEVAEPGVIEHIEGDRFSIGEPQGEKTERLLALADALRKAGLKAPIRPRIRDEIWVKLWGNLSFNPISALTGATLEQICGDPRTRALARAMMVEAQAIGERLGVRFPVDVDRRIAGAEAVGAHKTSMLQDLERGRAMEIDALVGAVAELGRLTAVPTPTIDTVLALVQQRGRIAGCYQ
ncbi:MAG: 2-dehydropantoate 2-reductase [Alphaproteobacteria bacterium]|nr:2-dehydropantoate 2-reductase [Alphaproteobacteria bacterium]